MGETSGAMTDAAGTTGARGPVRPVLIVAGAVLVLVAAAIAAVATLGSRTATYPAGSPEAAFQDYLAAFDEGDYEASYAYFSDAVKARLPYGQYVDECTSRAASGEDVRVIIERADLSGERATLRLVIERYYADGLQSSRYRSPGEVRLVRVDGRWRIDQRMVGAEPSYY
jgi:hypothetical protein